MNEEETLEQQEEPRTIGDVIQFSFTNKEGKRCVGGVDYNQVIELYHYAYSLAEKLPTEEERHEAMEKINGIITRNIWY